MQNYHRKQYHKLYTGRCKMNKIICWWSGGITSAVACKISIDLYGVDNCRCIFIDTKNEDEDTYRFMDDCERWYGLKIESITNEKYKNIQEVWMKFKGLNFAHGAICSSELKRAVRIGFEKKEKYDHQVFGFDVDEGKRAKAIKMNYPKSKPIFPLLFHGITKKNCIEIIHDAKIEIPRMYKLGFLNNNCAKTLCTQGGIGYWMMAKNMGGEWLEKFNRMGKLEHELTDIKGHPVTMLKDQGKGGGKVFLLPHPDYPGIKDITMMKGRTPKPLFECNGFCGSNELDDQNKTQFEMNYQKK